MKCLSASKVIFVPTPTLRIIFILLISFLGFSIVTGCGGGGGGNETPSSQQPAALTTVGQFKDANAAGISYVSGRQSGVTDSQGRFTYEVGEAVTFSVGNVTLGETEGKSIVTPVDLVEQGSSRSKPVVNIARFLISLDQDAEPSNGIAISQDVQMRAEDWTLEINSDDFDQELESIRPGLEEEYESFSDFPEETTARDHLEATFRCSYAGAYIGTYDGDDEGDFGILVSAADGHVSGLAYSKVYDGIYELEGETPISYDQMVAFTSGSTSEGTVFNGRFTSVREVEGTWGLGSTIGGNFSGQRIGGAQYAVYRATGTWRSDSSYDFGVFTFDINGSGTVTGFGYNVPEDIREDLSGTLSGTNLSATTSGGIQVTGKLDRATGVLTGRFSNSAGFSGTFQGNGCRLN